MILEQQHFDRWFIFRVRLVKDVGSHVTQQATENNIVGEAETLTLCFLSGSGSMKDTNGKIIIQDGTSL